MKSYQVGSSIQIKKWSVDYQDPNAPRAIFSLPSPPPNITNILNSHSTDHFCLVLKFLQMKPYTLQSFVPGFFH